jgi:hypothetical protein
MIEIEDIKKIKLDKDEVLLVKVPFQTTHPDVLKNIKSKITEFFPENKYLIVPHDFVFGVVKRRRKIKDGKL